MYLEYSIGYIPNSAGIEYKYNAAYVDRVNIYIIMLYRGQI